MSGSVNNLIALQAGQGVPQVENPLAQQQQYAQSRNMLLQSQNLMNQAQSFQAQRAQGQAALRSIDPTTGQYSPTKNNMLLAQMPSAAIGAGDAIAATQTQSQAQQTQAQQSQKQLASGIGGLLTLNGGAGPTYGQTTDFLKAQLTSGAIRPQSAQAALIGMPSGDDPQSTATRTHMIQTIQQQMASSQQQLENVYGTPTSVNNGQTAQPGMVGGMLSGNRGAFNPAGAPIQTQTSPDTNAGLVTVTNPDGSKSYVPRSSLPGATGVAGGGQGGPPAPGSPGAVLGTGRPAGPGTAPPAAAPPVSTGAGLAPGVAEAAGITAQASAAQGVDLGKTADAVPQRKAAFDNMLSDLQNFTPGPGADFQKTLTAALGRIPGMTFNTQGVASQEGFAKLAKQVALQQAGSLGAGTNEKLETSLGANPNVDLSKLGNTQILGVLKGNEDAIAAKNQAWQQWTQTNGTNTYSQFSARFNQGFDPRAYQTAYMKPAERKAIVSGLSAQERPAFINTLKAGIAAGTIPNPMAPSGQ